MSSESCKADCDSFKKLKQLEKEMEVLKLKNLELEKDKKFLSETVSTVSISLHQERQKTIKQHLEIGRLQYKNMDANSRAEAAEKEVLNMKGLAKAWQKLKTEPASAKLESYKELNECLLAGAAKMERKIVTMKKDLDAANPNCVKFKVGPSYRAEREEAEKRPPRPFNEFGPGCLFGYRRPEYSGSVAGDTQQPPETAGKNKDKSGEYQQVSISKKFKFLKKKSSTQ